MDWLQVMETAIDYLENHLLERDLLKKVAKEVYVSPLYLQKGFELMTGYTMGRYVRGRRLYLAALELVSKEEKVIDIALKYGYETPESFTKAFSRFHGATPTEVRQDTRRIKAFLPLKIKITMQGGDNMNYSIESMEGFQVVGFQKEFSYDTSYQEIPRFWDEIAEKYLMPLMSGKQPETPEEKAVCDYNIGELGVCMDDCEENGVFRYLIAGFYRGGTVPEGMVLVQFPQMNWAKFPCHGPLPGALQAVNTKVFQEWLPGNREYEIAMGANIEWYASGDCSADDYEAAIWLPVSELTSK